MTVFEKFCALPIDHSAIGYELPHDTTPYFCTPKNAKIIGWGGVDGIHYCTVGGFGELIFAVMPMNTPGDYVRPIARNFTDLLKLLLACGDMSVIDQAYFLDADSFYKLVSDNHGNANTRALLLLISDELCLIPMCEPYAYIKELQEEFDADALEFTEEYIALTAHTPKADPAWRVDFEGSFYGSRSREWVEPDVIELNKRFHWCGKEFSIPNLYLFEQGIVLDIIAAVAPPDYKAFLDDHLEAFHNEDAVTEEQRELIESENPLKNDYHANLTLNGELMHWCRGSGVCHIAPALRQEWFGTEDTGSDVIRHYGLTEDCCYQIRRISFPWPESGKPDEIETLSIRLEHEPMMYPSVHLTDPKAGDTFRIIHPFTEAEYTLSVLEIKNDQVDLKLFADEEMEFPTCYTAMRYTVEPPLSSHVLQISDCKNGDAPRKKQSEPDDPLLPKATGAAAVGIIGGADGPVGVLMGRTPETAISALTFAHQPVEWRLRFYIKLHSDTEVILIG